MAIASTPLLTRRRVLRVTGAVGLGVASSVSACLGSGPPVGGAIGRSSGAYSDWIADPELFQRDHLEYRFVQSAPLSEHEDEFEDATFDALAFEFESIDVEWDDADGLLVFGPVNVVFGAFDVEDAVEELEDERGRDFDEESEHEGYTFVVDGEGWEGFAISEQTIVNYRGDSVEDVLEDVIDTSLGDEDRFVDESEHFSELTSNLSRHHFVSGRTMEERDTEDLRYGIFRGMVAEGTGLQFRGETSQLSRVVVFEDSEDLDDDDFEDWIDRQEETNGWYTDLEDVETTFNGRVATLTGTIETDDI